MLKISLSSARYEGVWGDKALVAYEADGAVIHFTGDFPLRRIQQAARQLQSQGITAASLEGESWSYERQWAFYCGFATPKAEVELRWASIDEDELELLNARRRSADWVRKVSMPHRKICIQKSLRMKPYLSCLPLPVTLFPMNL